jgi:energy-coupling factor transport system ATP-binding protein
VNLLSFEHVGFAYGTSPVLRDVSFTVEPGETVALLGRNGAGKTTLTKLVVALLHPTRGVVRFGGRSIKGKAPEDVADRVAYVFQYPDRQLFARTVLDEVAFAPLRGGMEEREALRLAARALERVGLSESADDHPYDLPPAHRKLVTIAAAVAQQPRLLVLDEPTLGLDRDAGARVQTLLAEESAEGVAILGVTHDLAFVAEAMERALVLRGGALTYDAGVRALLAGGDSRELDLAAPPAIRLGQALGLADGLIRAGEVAAALRDRCRGMAAPVSSRVPHDQP